MADTAQFSSFRRLDTPARDAILVGPAATPPASGPCPPEPPTSAVVHHAALAAAPPLRSKSSFGHDQVWADLSVSDIGSDQLGLIHPHVITLHASLPQTAPIALEADTSGLYRPPNLRPVPWSGFASDTSRTASASPAADTRLLAGRGELDVERPLPGDPAMEPLGPELRPVAWIGPNPTA